MPTFDTPGPIEARLHFGLVVANVRVTAEPRSDTEIEVTAVDPARKADQRVAEQTKIEFAGGVLIATAPKLGGIFGRTGAVDVRLRLPEGSRLAGETGMGEVVIEGPVGDCTFRTGFGDMYVERAESANLKNGSGNIRLGEAGRAEVTASNGLVDIGRVDGPVRVANSNGTSRIGEATGEIRVKAANGLVTVERAYGDLLARSSNGRIEVGEVVRGTVRLEASAGTLDVGVREGSAAFLDLHSSSGRVRSELTAGDGPAAGEEQVAITARTHIGDIIVRRVR